MSSTTRRNANVRGMKYVAHGVSNKQSWHPGTLVAEHKNGQGKRDQSSFLHTTVVMVHVAYRAPSRKMVPKI